MLGPDQPVLCATDLNLDEHGARLHRGVLPPEVVERLTVLIEPLLGSRPGRRMPEAGFGGLLSASGLIGAVAASTLGPDARPVRAVVFDKSPTANWIVAWHQDRTIAVRGRNETEGFGPWSTKDGILHVAPPITVLEGMVTLRVHLDDCDKSNAPLVVALGSHRLGRLEASAVATVAEGLPTFTCCAEAGDVWAYSTPILHMSERSHAERRRRVVQIDYAARDLPAGMEWRGVG